MTLSAPAIDHRKRADVAAQLRAALAAQYPGWPASGGAGNGLVEVFARYAELVIQSINQVPDRNRVAFLSQLGGALLPPQPATVPLTFMLAPGGSTAAVVPAGTQVAASPSPGSTEPVVFETEAELVVTAAALDRLYVRSATEDLFADISSLLTKAPKAPNPLFTGTTPIEHTLYLGTDGFFGRHPLSRLSVSFDLEENAAIGKSDVAWELWNGTEGIALTPESDSTASLRHSGEVVFRNLPQFAPSQVHGNVKCWIRCRWLKPVQAPVIARNITLEGLIQSSGLLLSSAFVNATKIDFGKDFSPLGESPKFGDSFYVLNTDAFSRCGVRATLHVVMTNPANPEADSPVPRANALGGAKVAWEYWNGKQWGLLGTMSAQAKTGDETAPFSDTTQAFTLSGDISFTIPDDLQSTVVNGVQGPWVRARLVANGYGEEAGYLVSESKPGTLAYTYKPRTLSAPVLHQVQIDVQLLETGRYPDAVLAYNDFAFEDLTSALRGTLGDAELFHGSSVPEPALYLGFNPPFGLGMPTMPITLYFALGNATPEADTDRLETQRTRWQFWDGTRWVTFTVIDKTEGFASSGHVTLLAPRGAGLSEEFGERRYWLRVCWLMRSGPRAAPLRLVLQNTIVGSQTITLENEVLGSSNGAPDQVFVASRHPILEGEVLQVRAGLHDKSLASKRDWDVWTNVLDFHASGPFDRHYVLDRLSGSVTFGDGRHGAIPSRGTTNIRLRHYRTGGGAAGNKGVDTIVQLKTTVPYVRAVTNKEPASGGADAETLSAMLVRAPRSFRHRSRAVTVEDYEDLAMLASPDVARVRCVPLANLALDPDAKQILPGTVTVLVVPRLAEPKPLPSQHLLTRVRDYIQALQSATVQLVVTCPEYVELNVVAEIGTVSLDGMTEVETAIRKRLVEFMHPLVGGFDRQGWDFGRHPHRSDLVSLVSSVPGVDHIRSLTVGQVERRPGAASTKHFLGCPGEIRLTFTLV